MVASPSERKILVWEEKPQTNKKNNNKNPIKWVKVCTCLSDIRNCAAFTYLTDTLKNESFPFNTYYYPYIQGQLDTVDLTWKLDTGEPLTYTSWDNNEPRQVGTNIKVVEMKWATTYNNRMRPIICSYRL